MKKWKQKVSSWHVGQVVVAVVVLNVVAWVVFWLVNALVLPDPGEPFRVLAFTLAVASIVAILGAPFACLIILCTWFGAPRKP